MVISPARLTALLAVVAGAVAITGVLAGLGVIHSRYLGGLAIDDEFFGSAPLAIAGRHRRRLTRAAGAASGSASAPGPCSMAWGEAAIIIVPASGCPPALVPAGDPGRRGDRARGLGRARHRGGRAEVVACSTSHSSRWPARRRGRGRRSINPAYDVRLDRARIAALCRPARGLVRHLGLPGRRAARDRRRRRPGRGDVPGHCARQGCSWSSATSRRPARSSGPATPSALLLLSCRRALWLLQQLYGHRLRGDDERRTWQEFAEATRGLNRLDERDAVDRRHRRGARRSSAPRASRSTVAVPGGRHRRLRGTARRCTVARGAGAVQHRRRTGRPLRSALRGR